MSNLIINKNEKSDVVQKRLNKVINFVKKKLYKEEYQSFTDMFLTKVAGKNFIENMIYRNIFGECVICAIFPSIYCKKLETFLNKNNYKFERIKSSRRNSYYCYDIYL